ncbi:MAG TPA: MBL fold metallo-hydrolase [Syntrophales bacterium]|nr:MBL fold metallo-hydrolase [Syntrophales bacterium]
MTYSTAPPIFPTIMGCEEIHFGPVWFIPGVNRGRYPYCHSLYIQGPGIIIDPASDEKRLLEIRDLEGVNEVWLSHWHEDHITYLDLFPGAAVRICRRDEPPLGDLEILLDWYNLSEPHRDHWRQVLTETFRYRPRRADAYLTEGDVHSFATTTVQVIGAPGHTPGHLAFYFPEQEVLFVGDYDMTSFGPWYGDRNSSIEATISSLRRLREIPARTWITGHDTGVFTDNADERWRRYEDIIYQREANLLNLLARPHNLQEIVAAWLIYKKPREPLAFFEFGERALNVKHLDRLMEKGLVVERNGRYVQA